MKIIGAPVKLRCLKLTLLITGFNLLLSFGLVVYSSSGLSGQRAADARLLLSLEYRSPSEKDTTVESNAVPIEPDMQQQPAGSGRQSPGSQDFPIFDKSRKFKTRMFNMVGDTWSQLTNRRLCLGTQTSVDRLHHLVELAENWSGPMSVALFTPSIELDIARHYIVFLRNCFQPIRDRVSFHLSSPVEYDTYSLLTQTSYTPGYQFDCADHQELLQFLLEKRDQEMLSWRESYPYPQNLLRNVAKSGCPTNYTYIPDIDMVMPRGMNHQLEEFLQKQEERGDCATCAYVIPTYEVSTQVENPPTNKTELRKLIASGKARQFHQQIYADNQKASNLRAWEKQAQAASMDIAYQVPKYKFKYEPLYVARADTPQFDERFIGFGLTRNTQAYEMYVAGYSFQVLNNAFTYHWGFQSMKSRPKWRAKQQEMNNAKFDAFAKELVARYGRDPYNMIQLLPKLNLKRVKVSYGKPESPPQQVEPKKTTPPAKKSAPSSSAP